MPMGRDTFHQELCLSHQRSLQTHSSTVYSCLVWHHFHTNSLWASQPQTGKEVQHIRLFFLFHPLKGFTLSGSWLHTWLCHGSPVHFKCETHTVPNPFSLTGHLNPPGLYSLGTAFATHWTKGPKYPLGSASSVLSEQPQHNLPLLNQTFHQVFQESTLESFGGSGKFSAILKENPKRLLSKLKHIPYTTPE